MCSNSQVKSKWAYGVEPKEAKSVIMSREVSRSWSQRKVGRGGLRQTRIRHAGNFPSRLLDFLTIFSSHSPFQPVLPLANTVWAELAAQL